MCTHVPSTTHFPSCQQSIRCILAGMVPPECDARWRSPWKVGSWDGVLTTVKWGTVQHHGKAPLLITHNLCQKWLPQYVCEVIAVLSLTLGPFPLIIQSWACTPYDNTPLHWPLFLLPPLPLPTAKWKPVAPVEVTPMGTPTSTLIGWFWQSVIGGCNGFMLVGPLLQLLCVCQF